MELFLIRKRRLPAFAGVFADNAGFAPAVAFARWPSYGIPYALANAATAWLFPGKRPRNTALAADSAETTARTL